MRIRRLQLKEVRRYRELDIDLAPGLTVVRGPNEAGKTTIQRAIELAITRRVTSAAGDLESLRPWDAPPEARSVVTIEFEQDEEDGQKTGTLEKTFAGSRGTVNLEYDGQSIADPALADQVIAELTGIPTEGFFRATASIRHQELDDVTRDEASLRDRLQASISGADRGTSRARKKLDKAIYDLTTKGEKNPGRLKVAEQAVDKAQTSVEQGEAALAQLAGDRDLLAGAHDRRAETEKILAERRSMLEKARQAERLIADRDAAQERYERYRQAVEVTAELDQLATTHPSANPLPVLRAGVERLRAAGRPRPRAAGRAGRRGQRQVRGRSGADDLALGLAHLGRDGHRRPPDLDRVRRRQRAQDRDARDHPRRRRRGHRGHRPDPRRRRGRPAAQLFDERPAPRRGDRPPPARPLRDGGRARAVRRRYRAPARARSGSRTSPPPRRCWPPRRRMSGRSTG